MVPTYAFAIRFARDLLLGLEHLRRERQRLPEQQDGAEPVQVFAGVGRGGRPVARQGSAPLAWLAGAFDR
jgi:hypothetical protein